MGIGSSRRTDSSLVRVQSHALVAFEDVSYQIEQRTILRNVAFSVVAGETVVLLGRSGSGKTTLLRTVNGLVKPSSGQVLFQGSPVAASDLIALRRRIGYVLQEAGLLPHRTVAENVGLVPSLLGWTEERIAARVSTLLDLVELPLAIYGPRYPAHLSGGQRQRVGIARALAAEPPLLLMDEPFAALDPITRHELRRQFLKLQRQLGTGALFVTHDIREAMQLGTRIALLHEGAVAFLGTPDELRRSVLPEVAAFLATLEAV